MAKKPIEVSHRYRIHAETSVEDMGKVIAQLTILGLQNVGFELIEDVATYKNKTVHETSAEEVLMEYVKEHPTFVIKDAIKHFQPLGRTSGAMYTAARLLVEKKVLKKLGNGNYSSVHVKALAAPIKGKGKVAKEVKHKRNGGRVLPYDVPNKTILWNAIKNRKTFTLALLHEAFEKEGRPPKSISPIIAKLAAAKQIKNIAPGEYEVLKAKAALVSKPKTKTKKPAKKSGSPDHSQNGTAAPAAPAAE